MGTDSMTTARRWFAAFEAGDFDAMRGLLDDGVTFRGPLGEANSAVECIAGLRGMAGAATGINVLMMAAEGPDVLTWFDLHVASGESIAVVDWMHVEDGRIARIRAAFDPRPLLAGS